MITLKSSGRTRVYGHVGKDPMNINSSTARNSKSNFFCFRYMNPHVLCGRVFQLFLTAICQYVFFIYIKFCDCEEKMLKMHTGCSDVNMCGFFFSFLL